VAGPVNGGGRKEEGSGWRWGTRGGAAAIEDRGSSPSAERAESWSWNFIDTGLGRLGVLALTRPQRPQLARRNLVSCVVAAAGHWSRGWFYK
jgi:hypothetical protein